MNKVNNLYIYKKKNNKKFSNANDAFILPH